MEPERIAIPIGLESVSGLLLHPAGTKALYVFAHGAGTNMSHASMASNADGLAARGIATLRYNFLYSEKGSKRPDSPKIAHATVRAACEAARRRAGNLAIYAGGRSFGGRMTSQAQAEEPLPGVRGLAFLGFPLHPAGKPSVERADHLADVGVPMLFVSGSRDALAELDLLRWVVGHLEERATLHIVEHADHSFKVPRALDRTAADAEAEALDALANWMTG